VGSSVSTRARRWFGSPASEFLKAQFVRGEALSLPLSDRSVDRIFHEQLLRPSRADRYHLLREARRVAAEPLIVDCAWMPGLPPEGLEECSLRDGSRWVDPQVLLHARSAAGRAGQHSDDMTGLTRKPSALLLARRAATNASDRGESEQDVKVRSIWTASRVRALAT
jgi:hypothetical protein